MHLLVDSALIADFYFYFKKNLEMLVGDKIIGLMVKCTPEKGHNALFFI